jgi:hypothetical protein
MRSLPGIGVWTAAEVGQRALGDADSPSEFRRRSAQSASGVVVDLLTEAPTHSSMVALLKPSR